MCGISGFISLNAQPQAGDWLKKMNTTLAHRGPNDSGYWITDGSRMEAYADMSSNDYWRIRLKNIEEAIPAKVGFAHRRLAIIDLSADGHQPMHLNQELVVSFNGEIYNYVELRDELLSQGATFETNTDVEVLLKMWQKFGPDCLSRLEGMWAFSVYERSTDTVWLVRDRIGVKPLYFSKSDETLFFASEPKALLAVGSCSTKLNDAAVYSFLLHGSLEEENGALLADLKEVEPGHFLKWTKGHLTNHRYHHPDVADNWAPDSHVPEKLVEEISQNLERSIRLRLRSDVKVGASLSGGLDSSTIAVLAADKTGFPLFSAVYPSMPGDESHFANIVADAVNATWYKVEVNDHAISSELEEIVATMDSPLLTFSTFAQREIYRHAKKEGITILLDGQGGDELFTGYDRYWFSYHIQTIQSGGFSQFFSDSQAPSYFSSFCKSLLKYLVTPLLVHPLADPLLTSQLHNSKLEYRFLRPRVRHDFKRVSAQRIGRLPQTGVNAQLANERYGFALKNLLRWGDRNSMAFGMENRVPLADDSNLDAILLKLPANWKMNPSYGSKALLRRAMSGKLPVEILQRTDKMGFSAPIIPWMNRLWPQWSQYLVYTNEWLEVDLLYKQAPELLRSENGCLALLRFVSFGAWLKNLQIHAKSL
jgi:asparagine synthase (glutamine-hydrolysing)